MAAEIAATYLHCPPPLSARTHLSPKTVALAISALLHTPQKTSLTSRPPQTRPSDSVKRRAFSNPIENDDQFALRKMEWRAANSLSLPLSLRIIKRKKKPSEECSYDTPVKRAFSSMLFMVGEVQTHAIRMRTDRLLSDDLLTRVHGDLHDSFVWLFRRVFSATPTLMLELMRLLADFTVFSIARNDGFGAEVGLWKRVVEEAGEMRRERGRHEALMDLDLLRVLVSPVMVESVPDDLSVYEGTELRYRAALAEKPDDALFLCNFAQFLYVVYRDHER